jgi:hypothetical protein
MEPETTVGGRARAWVLVRAERAEDVAERLYERLGQEGGDSWVVVRADVVEYEYNMVVPVDAESAEMVHEVVGMIRDHPGVRDVVVAWVQRHIPYPPHDAHGYITEEELEASTKPEEPIKPGRQGASPGYNGWG